MMLAALTLTATGTAGASVDQNTVVRQGCLQGATALNPARFPRAPSIDNPWLPLVPGTRLVLKGQADRGAGQQPHEVIFTVTDLVKVIDGVANIVVWDRDIQEGEPAEAELAFFAQDLDGNVWNLGEYPEEYESGQFAGAPSTWFSGVNDAQGGIHMKANPQTGTGWYLQGRVPSIKFLDCARVVDTSARTCIGTRCFDPVLITNETSPLELGGAIQVKYHARGVGIVKIGARNDPEGETLTMVEHRPLTANELRFARASVHALERHAYETSKVYRKTQPMK